MKITENIEISSVTELNKFCTEASKCHTPVEVKSGRYIVDGKSIMGVLSLDLTKEVTVEFDDTESNFAKAIIGFVKD